MTGFRERIYKWMLNQKSFIFTEFKLKRERHEIERKIHTTVHRQIIMNRK
jgi:hypothetical protein